MVDALTVWRARCFHEACRVRDREGREFQVVEQAHPWVLGHALNHSRGGHVVAVWPVDDPRAGHLIRYCHPLHPVREWLPGWAWACFGCRPGPGGAPVWNEGHMDRKGVLAEWRGHTCTRGVTE
jgi:hypothetical protein